MSQGDKIIFKNTLLLYFRMMLIMIVSLYTVRLILNSLGVVDYGIFNVVGGLVIMVSFLSNTMATTSQRFFAFELGNNNESRLNKIFIMTLNIYFIISFIILILLETVGYWILNYKMNIPIHRLDAANWVYQFSILTFIINILTIPYNSLILAYEKMDVYAYIGILEVILKLVSVYFLLLLPYDKLKLYAILFFIVTIIISLIYITFCKKKYKESQFEFYWDKNIFKSLLNFSGWNLFGGLAGVLNSQGINILLNFYFGPVVNSSRGVAYQVSSAINQLVQNFNLATNPQITKFYAKGEKEKMIELVFRSSKISYFLILILSIPILLETNFLLILWLKIIPEYVVIFLQLIVINSMIDSLSYAFQTTAQATGNIKFYQIIVGGVLLLNLPLSFVFLKFGFPPQITFYISIIFSIICLFLRLIIINRILKFNFFGYLKIVLIPVIKITFLTLLFSSILKFYLQEGVLRVALLSFFSTLSSMFFIYLFGVNALERFLIKKSYYKFINKIKWK